MEEPRVTWNDERDTGKKFTGPKIKSITDEIPELLPNIPADVDAPCVPRRHADVNTDEKFIWTKNLIPILADAALESDPTKNIFGPKYFDDITPLLAPSARGDVQLEVSLFKNIDGVEFTCHFKVECNEVNFQITKNIDGQKVNFNSNYKLIRPAYAGGRLQPGKFIFRPYADPERFPGRVPRKVGYTRVKKVVVNNFLKDLKELLNLPADKELVKIDATYETIDILLNKLRIREGTADYEKFSRTFFGLQTEEKMCTHLNILKSQYREYLNAGIKEKDAATGADKIVPIEELTTFDKLVKIGNDYMHPNQVRDIKRLAPLDRRFVMKKITEVQQLVMDDDGRKTPDVVERFKLNGYPKIAVNKVADDKYWPVNYGFFTPFTFTDLLSTKVGTDYFRNAIGITTENYKMWFEKIEEFKSKCLFFVSLYHMLTLSASKYIFITPETRTARGAALRHGNSKKDSPMYIIEYNLSNIYPGKDYAGNNLLTRQVCFFSHFAQENPSARDRTINPTQKLVVGEHLEGRNLKAPIAGTTDITNLILTPLVYFEVIEGNVDTTLEKAITTRDEPISRETIAKLLGEEIEDVPERDATQTYEYNEEDFNSLLTPEDLDTFMCERAKAEEARRLANMKSFAEIAAQLVEGDFPVPAKTIDLRENNRRKKKTVVEELDDDEDADFQVAEVELGRGGVSGGVSVDPCKLDLDNDPNRRRGLIKEIINDPLRCLRVEEAESIWKRMNPELKRPVQGLSRTDKIENFFIASKTKELQKVGVKEEDIEFKVKYAWYLLMGKEYVNKILKSYLIKLQKAYNQSYEGEELVETKMVEGAPKPTPYFSTFASFTQGEEEYDEKEICNKFLDGMKSRTNERRAEGLKQALKFIENFNRSQYAREAVIEFMKGCTEPEYTNYIKVTFGIDDEEVPPCQGGERIRRRGGVTDLLEADDKTFTSDQLADYGINPPIPEGSRDTFVLDAARYKTKIRVLLSQVVGAEKKLEKFTTKIAEKKERGDAGRATKRGTAAVQWNEEFIDAMFESLSRSKMISMQDFIDGRDRPVTVGADGATDPSAKFTDLLEYRVFEHDDSKLSNIKIKTDSDQGKLRTKIKKILEKTGFYPRKIAIYAKLQKDGKTVVNQKADDYTNEILRIMSDKTTTFAEALEQAEAIVGGEAAAGENKRDLATRLKRDYASTKPPLSGKQAEAAAEIILDFRARGKSISEADAVAVARGKKTRESLGGGYDSYIKYKTKYLSLVDKLRNLGVNI